MKKLFYLLFLLITLSSCASIVNSIFFSAKSEKIVEVQLVKNIEYQINLEGYKISDETIDSLLIDIFKKKNIKIVTHKSRYKLEFFKFNYHIEKIKAEATDKTGMGTSQYGMQLNIQLEIESKISDTLTKKEKIIKPGHSEIKPVYSDFLFDFFAVDSEDSFNPGKPIKSSFNMLTHKAVKFVNKQK